MENIFISKLFVSTDCPRESKEFFIFYIMKEIWKDIEGFEGYYQISSLGNVKRVACEITYKNGKICRYKEKILKKDLVKGYLRVTLSKKNTTKRFLVHRLVAESFISNYENKKYVNHINGKKTDNRVENLEWCTASENEIHSYKMLGKKNVNRKLTESDVLYIKENAVKGNNRKGSGNILELSKKYNVCKSTILNIIKNKYYVC